MNRYKMKIIGVSFLYTAIFFLSLVLMLTVKVTIFIADLIFNVFNRVLLAIRKETNDPQKNEIWKWKIALFYNHD